MNLQSLYKVLTELAQYRQIIQILAMLLVIIILGIIVVNVLLNLIEQIKVSENERRRQDSLRNIDYGEVDVNKKAELLRDACAPDGLDTGPNSYLIVNDSGRDIYTRQLTIFSLPRKTKFANTFRDLLDYPGCVSSIFIEPFSEDAMIRKMDKHIEILDGEGNSAYGEPNRQRKLAKQQNDAERFASEVESGENKIFDVGFVFTLKSESLKELNRITEDFHSKGLAKGITVINCYGVQPEAFLQNGPFNRTIQVEGITIKSDAIKFHQMDKKSLATIFNYTQSSYSHKNGVALGRDLFSAAPVMFDLFDGSHDGFTVCIAGRTRSGKSSMIKMLSARQLLHGYHFVAIDCQERKGMGEGEYAALAKMAGGVNFKITTNSPEIMNIFEISESYSAETDTLNNTKHEIRTLELADKIAMVSSNLMTLIYGGDNVDNNSVETNTYINRIVVDNLNNLYAAFGIVDGDPDSIYTKPGASNASDAIGITNGLPIKKMPTLTDYYKQLLISRKNNTSSALENAYNVVIMGLQDYVKELYYSEKSVVFLTKEQVERASYDESLGGKRFVNRDGGYEKIVEIHGIRAYFDGQSTIHISKDIPFTNIDISQLPEKERTLIQQVALDFVNENFIKKNSESISSADKLVIICDEAHMLFANPYAVKTLNGIVRTARKRNVGSYICTQTLSEYGRSKDTKDILSQASVKFTFKQAPQDREYLMKTLDLTAAQAEYIVGRLGGTDSVGEEDAKKHRGEVCIIDGKAVCFCKVDYRKASEAIIVETDAEGIAQLFAS